MEKWVTNLSEIIFVGTAVREKLAELMGHVSVGNPRSLVHPIVVNESVAAKENPGSCYVTSITINSLYVLERRYISPVTRVMLEFLVDCR